MLGFCETVVASCVNELCGLDQRVLKLQQIVVLRIFIADMGL